MPQLLQLKLLGGFDLWYDGKSLTGEISERLQSLLTYLVLNQQTPQSRSHLAFVFWSDSQDSQARTNLRRIIHDLRRILPSVEQFINIDSKTLHWRQDAPASIDVVEFELAIASAEAAQISAPSSVRGALERSASIYKGKLLPNCCDQWIELEQERLHQACIRVYTWLIQILQEQQDYSTALRYAQQLLRIDSSYEVGYAHLIQLYALVGDRAQALQTYHRCMTALREELGVDPSTTTRKLYEQILLDKDEHYHEISPMSRGMCYPPSETAMPTVERKQPIAKVNSLSPLIGRQREWAIIQQWMSGSTTESVSPVLLVVGEPGIGKTRLLEELRATMPANQVLWGRGFAAEMVRPYGIWADALRSKVIPQSCSIPAEIGFLLPERGKPSKTPPDRSHLFDTVVQLLGDWINQAPLVVILDDIQWLDEASSALLHYAVRLLNHLPVRFACTARSGELAENPAISRVVQALRRERQLQILELSSLNRGQTAELIRSAPAISVSSLSLELVDRVFNDSGGNPLFVMEIVRALSQERGADSDNLEALIGDRLQRLDDSARELLPWAAALGRSFQPTMLAQVSDYTLPQLLTAIEQLEQQTIIRPSFADVEEVGYDFAHDIVRQVVYRQLSQPRRQLVHLQIAHKLKQRLSSDINLAADVAHHASLGNDPQLAASTALLAAERCLKVFAYAEAGKLAQQGIQQCQRLEDERRIRLSLRLLQVWVMSGVTGDVAAQLETEVQQLIQEASRWGWKDEEAVGLETLGMLYFNQNNFADIHPHLLRSVEIARAASPGMSARLLASTGSCLAEIGRDMARAEALLVEAQSLAERVGLQLYDIDSGLGIMHYHHSRYTEARTLLQQAWRLAQIEQNHWRECIYLGYLIMIELESDAPAAALPYCEEMARVAAQIQGEGSEGAIAAALRALVNYRLQQPGANAQIEQAMAMLQQVDAKRMLSYVMIGIAEVDLECHRPELAVVRAETALSAAKIIHHPSEIALAWAILIQGLLAVGNWQQGIAQFEFLQTQIEPHSLSVRGRTAVGQVLKQIQQLSPSTNNL